MSEVKTYAVNCNDAWLNTEGEFVMFDDVISLVQFDTTAQQFESLAKSE